MVHRIQNRNPGYSDFSNLGSNTSFNFSNNNTNPVSHGANALKLENEIISEKFNETVGEVNDRYNEELLKNQEAEKIVDNVSQQDEVSFSQEALNTSEDTTDNFNDLKEFGVDTEEPDLFSSENDNSNSDDLFGVSDE